MNEIERFHKFVDERWCDTLVTAETGLAIHGLVNSYNTYCVMTDVKALNNCVLELVTFKFWYFDNLEFTEEVYPRMFVPTAERAIIDCMIWQSKNYDEGFLIEALQNYQYKGHVVSDLYEVADYFNLDRRVVDYWWHEAEEESDMSMG